MILQADLQADISQLQTLLQISADRHRHLCPRQVLGVRMGLAAGRQLGLEVPQADKRMFCFMETDGCGMDGVAIASGCFVGRRTMYMLDFGKLAATFVDTQTCQAIRIHPHPDARDRAWDYATDRSGKWRAQLTGYQTMPDDKLLIIQPVTLTASLEALISRPGVRAICEQCGEEIMNEREVIRSGQTLCRACAGQRYYVIAPTGEPLT